MEVENDQKVVTVAPGYHLLPRVELLQRVLASEIGNVRPSSYLVLAVHAVMLETGFVRAGTQEGLSTFEGYHLQPGWNAAELVSVTYTLPELRRSFHTSPKRRLAERTLLRFQTIGNTVVVYGAVNGGTAHRLSLSISKFLCENVMIREFGQESSRRDESDVVRSLGETRALGSSAGQGAWIVNKEKDVFRDIFELWKEVKNCLSLPLLTTICETAGLPPPPSLLRLPRELKIKVLDSLMSLALANVSCACSEFRFLAGSEDLWKQRYKEEFGASGNTAPGCRGWKSAFAREFEHRKRRKEERGEAEAPRRAAGYPPGLRMRPAYFRGLDRFQGLGGVQRGGFGGYRTDISGGGWNFAFPGGPPGNPTLCPNSWAAGGRVASHASWRRALCRRGLYMFSPY